MKREKRDLWRLAAVQQALKKTDVCRIIDELLAFNQKIKKKKKKKERVKEKSKMD